MYSLEINKRKLDLLKRTNILLERTKINYQKYKKERKMLLDLTRKELIDYCEWENILRTIENLVNINSK